MTQIWLTIKRRTYLTILVMVLCIISVILTFLTTRFYDYRNQIAQQAAEISTLRTQLNDFQQVMNVSYSNLKKMSALPVLYETTGPEVVDEEPVETVAKK